MNSVDARWARPPTLRRVAWIALAGWSALGTLMVLAIHTDYRLAGQARPLGHTVAVFLPQVLLMVPASVLLAWLFSRWGFRLLRARYFGAALLAWLALGLPLMAVNNIVFRILSGNEPWSAFAGMLLARSNIKAWFDSFVLLLAFALQAGYSSWLHTHRQALARQLTEQDNLRLRLHLLQGQLKPHFLFNAINSISALVRTADCAIAGQALARLNALLDYALQSARHEQRSVAEELAFIDGYLELQRLRHGERLRIERTVGPAPWATLSCPPLLFHPLVENAIHHGVEPHHHACTLTIALALRDGMIELRVGNPILAPAQGGHGMGLAATRERLAILYQHRADLTIDHHEHAFAATLRFPARPTP